MRLFFFNDLEEKVNCMLMKFSDSTKLEGVIDRSVGQELYKPPLKRLEIVEKMTMRLHLEKTG